MKIKYQHVQHFVGEPYLSRGKEYFNEQMVYVICQKDSEVKAKVVGSTVYLVNVTFMNNQLNGTCSCQAFADYGPCKHIAATCFAIIDTDYEPSRECEEFIERHTKLEKMLKNKSKEELIDLLFQLMTQYPQIEDDLMY